MVTGMWSIDVRAWLLRCVLDKDAFCPLVCCFFDFISVFLVFWCYVKIQTVSSWFNKRKASIKSRSPCFSFTLTLKSIPSSVITIHLVRLCSSERRDKKKKNTNESEVQPAVCHETHILTAALSEVNAAVVLSVLSSGCGVLLLSLRIRVSSVGSGGKKVDDPALPNRHSESFCLN